MSNVGHFKPLEDYIKSVADSLDGDQELPSNGPALLKLAEIVFQNEMFEEYRMQEVLNGRGGSFMQMIRTLFNTYTLNTKHYIPVPNVKTYTYNFKTIDVFYSFPRNVILYGRAEDGKRLIVKDNTFYPYTLIRMDIEEDLSVFENNPSILHVERCKASIGPREYDMVKVYTITPWYIRELREAFPYFDFYGSDIEFALRYFYDKDLSYINEVTVSEDGHDIQLKNTDTIRRSESIPEVELVRASFDIETSVIDTSKMLCLSTVVRPWNGEADVSKIFEGQNKINPSMVDIEMYVKDNELSFKLSGGTSIQQIATFENFIEYVDPDVITGYYIQGFDFPAMNDMIMDDTRGIHLGYGHRKLKMGKHMRSHGRVLSDTMFMVRKIEKPKRESLNYVANLLLGEEKDDVKTWNIDQEWKDDKQKVIDYCLKDSRLTLDIFDKIEGVQKLEALAAKSWNTLAMVGYDSQARLIDSRMIRKADSRGVAVPMNKFDKKDKDEKISGADVSDAVAGIFEWAAVMDVQSMYPSMFIKYNIDMTTFIPEGMEFDEDQYNESPIGAKFLKEPRGIVPEILSDLWAERDELKLKMKNAETEHEKKHYDFLQGAVKILMNATYGVFASSFYRFTNPEIGESITTWAVAHKLTLEKLLKDEGYSILYGDTDSVFFKLKNENLEQAVPEGKELEDYVSGALGITVEFEKILDPMIQMGTKKKYIAKAIWPKESLYIRGIETRRGDSFDAQSDMLEAMIERLIEKDLVGATEEARKVLKNTDNIDPDKLSITKSVKKISNYKNPDNMQNVKVYRQLKKAKRPAFEGMKVTWVILKTGPRALELLTDEEKYIIDYDYYKDRLLDNALRILEPLGVSKIELLYKQKQMGLENYFSV